MIARLYGRRDGARRHAGGTRSELLARLGRLLLWLTVGLLLARGATDLLQRERPAAQSRAPRASEPGWPDEAARSFAIEFANHYFSHFPREAPGVHARRLAALAAPQIAVEVAPRRGVGAPAQLVHSASVAGTVRIDRRRAVVSVAAAVASADGMEVRRLVVPVARDDAGGLVVYDLPSLGPAPPRAAVGPSETEPLMGTNRAQVQDVVKRFLRAYLAGDAGGLAYVVAPGSRIRAATGGLELRSLTSLAAAGPAGRAGRVVLATADVRDLRSRAMYLLRYRIRLERRDRWYVAELDGGRGPR